MHHCLYPKINVCVLGMHDFIYECTYLCMCASIHICINEDIHVLYACKYVCIHACLCMNPMHVCVWPDMNGCVGAYLYVNMYLHM